MQGARQGSRSALKRQVVDPLVVDDRPTCTGTRQSVRPFEGCRQAGLGEIRSRRITQAAVDHGDHGTVLVSALRRFGHVLADAELLRVFAHATH